MIGKFKEAVDNVNESGALLTNFSKAFDCTDHSSLPAKTYDYEVSHISLRLIFLIMLLRQLNFGVLAV